MKRLVLLLAAVTLFAAATHTITINPGETVSLGDVQIVAPPLPPAEPCPECPACPECPEVPPVEPLPIEPPPVVVPPPTTGTMPLGVNLPGPDEWNFGARAKVFVDVMKTARMIAPNRWRVLTTSNNQEQSLNWSTSGSRQPKVAGTYLLSFEGGASVSTSGASIRNITSSNGVTIADVVLTTDSNDVDLIFSNAASNIRMLRPGYPRGTAQTVTDEFKAFIAPFDTIRFMDAMVTNWAVGDDPLFATDVVAGTQSYVNRRTQGFTGEKVTGNAPFRLWDGTDVVRPLTVTLMNWADRPPDAAQSYHRPWGISVEAIVRICNETMCNPWICLPPNFADDYATGLAGYLHDNLNPALEARLEVGNENPWNDIPSFGQAKVIIAQADAAAKLDPNLQNPPQNWWYLGTRFVVKRTIDASNIFRGVYGSSYDDRVQFVVSSQFSNASYLANALNWALRSYPNPPSYYIAGIACAPYIGAQDGPPDQIVDDLTADIATRQANDSKLMWWRGMADAYQVGLYMYEAGIDMGQGTGNLTNRIAAAYDPRMQIVEQKYLESCYFDAGARNLMYFNGVCTRDKWGPAWGLTDDAVDLQQPMYRGAVAFTSSPSVSGGLTATFYSKSDFTGPLGTIVIPVFNHRWQNWATGGIWGRKDVTTTEARNGSIRMTGRYIGAGTLSVEKEANDGAVLTRNGQQIQIDYRAIFDGSGVAWGRLMADGKLVRQSELSPS